MEAPLLVLLVLLEGVGEAAAGDAAAVLAAEPLLAPASEEVLLASPGAAACASAGFAADAPLLPPRKSVTYQPEPLS